MEKVIVMLVSLMVLLPAFLSGHVQPGVTGESEDVAVQTGLPLRFDRFVVRQSAGKLMIEVEVTAGQEGAKAEYRIYEGERSEPSKTVSLTDEEYVSFCGELESADVLNFETAEDTPPMGTPRVYVYEYELEYAGRSSTARWTAANRHYCSVYTAAQMLIDDEVYALE